MGWKADSGGGAFSRIYGHRAALWPDAKAEEEAGDEEVPPGIGKRLPEARHGRYEARDCNGVTSAERLVERVGEPCCVVVSPLHIRGRVALKGRHIYQQAIVKQQR